MAAFTFDERAATGADKGGIIQFSGVYKGRFTKAVAGKTQNGAKYVEFEFEAESGESCKYLKVYTTKRDGERAFGYGMMCALMGLLNFQTVDAVQDGDVFTLPAFCGKLITVALQREEYKHNGKLKWKMNILHFFDAVTKQTYAEKKAGKPAKIHERPIKDKIADSIASGSKEASDDPVPEDDLPF